MKERARNLIGEAVRAYDADPEVVGRLRRISARLDEPVRIALAGTLKSGKSTLINALVGEAIAPTGATETTRIVTWFRHGGTPRATANTISGRVDLPIQRGSGLDFDLGQCDPADVVDIDVEWPAPELVLATVIDTPGTSSLTPGVSERTVSLLLPVDGVPRVDAVVFLLRSLNAADVALLTQIGHLIGGSAGAIGVIGVASRADEIGAGRMDAMLSAKEVAGRFTAEMDRSGVCQAVVPVSGLLAFTARTLRQSEFDALRTLSAVEPAELNKAMLSVDRFVRDDAEMPVDVATRVDLLGRFGLFGVRIAVTVLRAGVLQDKPIDADTLAADLLERSGLVALREVIDQQIAQRADLLKAHTALVALRRIVTTHPTAAGSRLLADIDPLLADTHAFEELRLLTQLPSRPTTLTDEETASLRRIIGGAGTGADSRLGLTSTTLADGPRAAFAAARRWRRRAEHPLNDPFTSRACRVAMRSAEALVAEYSRGGNP